MRDRIHRVPDIFADEVGPRLLNHSQLTSVAFETNGRRIITIGQMRAAGGKPDAAECCNIILNSPEALFEDIRQTVKDLKHLRGLVSHPTKHVFVEAHAVSAASWVVRLLQRFGERLPPTAKRFGGAADDPRRTQLCALVVLADRRVPGDGFYWTVRCEGRCFSRKEDRKAQEGSEEGAPTLSARLAGLTRLKRTTRAAVGVRRLRLL